MSPNMKLSIYGSPGWAKRAQHKAPHTGFPAHVSMHAAKATGPAVACEMQNSSITTKRNVVIVIFIFKCLLCFLWTAWIIFLFCLKW